ncbi:MAG: hypothetical protein ACNYPE_08765 [Candidatus Azotimanducaceae bacterium WSBS_2022_MAG_OTU7]
MPEDNDFAFAFASKKPGVMHACGHDQGNRKAG